MPLVDPSCFLSLTTSERWEQIYLASGGESECFREQSILEQQRLILGVLGSEECIYSTDDFWRAWAAILGVSCVESQMDAQRQIYAAYYEEASDDTLTDPSCFLGLGVDGAFLALFEAKVASFLAAPQSLEAESNGDGTFDASWDAVNNAVGYEYSIDGGPWVDIGNVTFLNNVAIP